MEFSSSDLERLGQRVVGFITRYFSELETSDSVLGKRLTPTGLRSLLGEALPRQPQGIEAAFEDFETKIAANSIKVGHPRFLAWTRTSPIGVAVMAESLAAALNQSVAVWEGAPAATEVELLVLGWLKEILGYPGQAGAILTSGGSMANFVCLLAALAAVEPRARTEGLYELPPFCIYTTSETHYCIQKAAEMAGLGRRSIRRVEIDNDLRMHPPALAAQIQEDRRAGLRPLMVAATFGTVNSGACDDLVALGEICRELKVWLHVDAAYGGSAAYLAEKRHLSAGLDQVDSLVFDPHKGLFMPFEAGCALVREARHLKSAFAVETDYLPNSQEVEFNQSSNSPFHFRDYGPQLSRSFRALKLYLSLKAYGIDRIADELSQQYSLAAEFGQRLQESIDFELLAPVPLGIVAFRYIGYHTGSQESRPVELDKINSKILTEVQREGKAFISGTRLRECFALRACFASHRTSVADLDIILEEVRRAAQNVG